MNAIEQYIENLFAGLPKTEASERLKQNLLADSQERYRELLAEGKTEAEALGLVVERFGSMDDIMEQLNATENQEQPKPTPEPQPAPKPAPDREAASQWDTGKGQGAMAFIRNMPESAVWMSTSLIYLVLGFFFNLWHPGWLIFLIPVALRSPIGFKDMPQLNIWMVATVVYLILGFLFKLWHPGWLVFMVAAIVQVMAQQNKE